MNNRCLCRKFVEVTVGSGTTSSVISYYSFSFGSGFFLHLIICSSTC